MYLFTHQLANMWIIPQTLKEIILNRLIGLNSLNTNSTENVIQRTILSVVRFWIDILLWSDFEQPLPVQTYNLINPFFWISENAATNHKILRRNKSYVMVPKVHTKRRCWSLGLLCKKTPPRVPKVMVFEVNFKIDYLLS